VLLFLDEGELIHLRAGLRHVDLGDESRMGVIDVVGVRGILFGTDQERDDRRERPVEILDLLGEAERLTRRTRIDPIRTRKRPEIRIKRTILLIEDEDVLHVFAEGRDEGIAPFRGRLLPRARGLSNGGRRGRHRCGRQKGDGGAPSREPFCNSHEHLQVARCSTPP